jgi:flagellar basal-body rod protein FlgF
MDRLIYTAVTGMNDSMTRERVIASNMANAQTIGFKAELIYSNPVTLKGQSIEARAMSQAEVHGADMSGGTVSATGRPLDIAVRGNDDMIALQAADGTEVYSRRGDLTVAPSGVLQNGDGRPVLGQGGPITVPLDSSLSIAPDGSLLARNKDQPNQQPIVLDKIKLVSTGGSQVMKGLDGLFRVVGGGVLPTNDAAQVQPESLEQSNVDPSEVMVGMIQAQRLFDIRTKLIATAKDVDQAGTTLLRMSAS